jgi:hypothetical protein
MIDIEQLLSHKKLAQWDCGVVRVVRPTGRYIDAKHGETVPLYYEERLRYSVEIKDGWFDTKWVLACNLKPVSTSATARRARVRWEC